MIGEQKVILYELDFALTEANMIKSELEKFCKEGMCIIVGSIKRRKEYVKDIEILCCPLVTTEEQANLFGEEELRHSGFIHTVRKYKVIKGDPVNGKYIKIQLPSGIKVDIFTAREKNWGVQKLIRTGPAKYSQSMMFYLNSHGFKVANGGFLYRYRHGGQWDRIPIHTEREFYHVIGRKYEKPENRTVVE